MADYTHLQAGRELDELVAEKVLGWQRHHDFYGDDGYECWHWVGAKGEVVTSAMWLNDNPTTPYFSRDLGDLHRFLLSNLSLLNLEIYFMQKLSDLLYPDVEVSYGNIKMCSRGALGSLSYLWGLVNATPYQCCIAALQAVDLKYEIDNGLVSWAYV